MLPFKVLIAPGHGIQPNGNFDTGATYKDGEGNEYLEHEFNREVVLHAGVYLKNRNINVIVEQSGLAGRKSHDPNWVGTLKTIRSDRTITVGVEVHHDYSLAPRGGFGILPRGRWNDEMAALARSIRDAYISGELAVRTNYSDVRGLGFLRSTPTPTLIWECGRMEPTDHSVLIARGNSLASGIIAWARNAGYSI